MAGLEHNAVGKIAAPVKESPAGPAQPLHVEVSRSHLRCLIWNTSEKQKLTRSLVLP